MQEYGGSAEEENYGNDITLRVEQTAPSRERIRGLKKILFDPVERESFKSFLSLEFAYENLQVII